jgi:hypothetical protein
MLAPCAAGAAADADGSDEDDGSSLFGKLFLNTAYVEHEFAFGEGAAARTLRVAVSQAACTDYDLTGQTTWPGARLLTRWLAAQPDSFFAHAALELGAGTGLAGLYFASRGGDVVLTDHHTVVMSLLRRNAGAAARAVHVAAASGAAHARECAAGDVRVARLLWGDEAAGQALRGGTPYGAGFRCLLGADILYPGSQRALPGLMASICQLLAPHAEAALYLCYCSRAGTTDRALAAALAAANLVSTVAPGGDAVAEGGVEGVVYRVTRGAAQSGSA